jgi:hypothetical protein
LRAFLSGGRVSGGLDRDLARLLGFGDGQLEAEDAVDVARDGLLAVEGVRQAEAADELAGGALAAEAGRLRDIELTMLTSRDAASTPGTSAVIT